MLVVLKDSGDPMISPQAQDFLASVKKYNSVFEAQVAISSQDIVETDFRERVTTERSRESYNQSHR